jgi:hypothetical protein
MRSAGCGTVATVMTAAGTRMSKRATQAEWAATQVPASERAGESEGERPPEHE